VRAVPGVSRARVEKLGIKNPIQDRRVRYPLTLIAVLIAVTVVFGPVGLAFFVAQAAFSIFFLESINYVEHYGLRRKEVNGGFERVTEQHSWTSAHRVTSYYLLNLPRHADHHAQASRPFFALRHIEEAPQLPAGYATMLIVSWVPPLWRAIMDPRLDRWSHGPADAAALVERLS
jgi:alkane 1-monooxygenase